MTALDFAAITAVGLAFILDPASQVIDPRVQHLLAMRDEETRTIAELLARIEKHGGRRSDSLTELSAQVQRAREGRHWVEMEILTAYGMPARAYAA